MKIRVHIENGQDSSAVRNHSDELFKMQNQRYQEYLDGKVTMVSSEESKKRTRQASEGKTNRNKY